MCRSIKTLRPPYVEAPTEQEMAAAALQYVRKISGMRKPAKANVEAFDRAVAAVAAATADLLDHLEIRPQSVRRSASDATSDLEGSTAVRVSATDVEKVSR